MKEELRDLPEGAVSTAAAVRAFLHDVAVAYPARLAAIILAMSVVSLSEGVGIALLIPLLGIIGIGGAVPASGGRLVRTMEAAFAIVGLRLTLLSVLGAFVAIVVCENLVRLVQRTAARRFLADFSLKVRLELYDAYLDAGWPFWVRSHLGHMASRLTVEATRVEAAVYYLTTFLSEGLFAIVLLVVAFAVSWQLALFFVVGGGLFFGLMRGRFRGADRSGSAISNKNNELHETVQEHLNAAKFIKTSATRRRSFAAIQDLMRELLEAETRGNVHAYRMGALLQPVTAVLLAMGLYIALTRLHMTGPQLLVVLVVFYRVSPKVATIQQMWHSLGLAAPAYVSIARAREAATAARERLPQGRSVTLSRELALERVTFGYAPDMTVLRDVSLRIPVNRTIALVGPSGSGKSTVLDLILGLLEPRDGVITIDGVPLSAVDMPAWRRQVGFVAQDSVLFFDTIRENIRWAVRSATDAEVEDAARLAFAHDFIMALPNGYDTSIGHRGVRLSGGERQRIALARALVGRPRLLILDEATSNLDAISERAVQDAIDGLRNRMTILVIAHRLVTIRSADRIYVLEQGCVVQEGTWDELVGSAGKFSQLWSLQQAAVEPSPAATR